MADTLDSPQYDVVIVGAGLSGLYAASILKEHGLKFCVLEARDRVGGRTFTKKDSKVGYVDLGGAYIGPSQLYMQQLISKLNLKTYKVNASGKSVYLNKRRRFVHEGDQLPTMNALVELEVKNVLGMMEQMSQQVPREQPWNAAQAREWDRITLGQFLDKHCWTQEAKDFIAIYIGCCTSCEPYEESLLWTLWYIRQCEGLEVMYNTENAAQDSKVVGGTQQISEKLRHLVGAHNVMLNKPVVHIRKVLEPTFDKAETEDGRSDKVERSGLPRVEITTLDGSHYCCSYVILAIPPVLQHKIHFDPSLPPLYNQLIQKFPMGSAIKCIVYYEETFWRDQSLNGNMLINCSAEEGPITYTLDDTKPDGTYPAIVGFIIGDRAREMLTKTKEERLKLICDSYAKAFDSPKALKPVHYEEKNWMSEQYTGGCFTGLGAPGFLTNYGELLSKPLLDCIFLAGTETATHWAGYMDGALQAAHRAANQVLHRFGLAAPLKPVVSRHSLECKEMARQISVSSGTMFTPSINQLLTWSSILVALFGFIAMTSF